MLPERLAVYTTVHAGVERFLGEWHGSVAAQSDRDFDLCVALDGMEPADAAAAMGGEVDARWLRSPQGATPARIRSEALQQLVAEYDAIVMVDSDDVLLPSRLAAAREMLEQFDVAGCALDVMDAEGRDLGIVFGVADGSEAVRMLPRWNVFGMSNTAWRASALRSVLPIPEDTLLIDWLLATRAWSSGAALGFDPVPRMRYRQYGANTAPMLPPFRAPDVLTAADRVLGHYRHALDDGWRLDPERRRALEAERARVAEFATGMRRRPDRLARYVDELNHLPPEGVWWWQVAHPVLEKTWSS